MTVIPHPHPRHTQKHTVFLSWDQISRNNYLFQGHVDPEPDSRCFMTTEEQEQAQEGAMLFLFWFLTICLGLQDPLQVPEGS